MKPIPADGATAMNCSTCYNTRNVALTSGMGNISEARMLALIRMG